MDKETSARLLWAAMGGVLAAAAIERFAPLGTGMARAVKLAMVFLLVSLVVYRFLARRASGE